ncbi:MAG: pseudouridine synthase, partial [Myxococcales bacterium]|nr:pseudouridine synthase [Myxococcales bacterium]
MTKRRGAATGETTSDEDRPTQKGGVRLQRYLASAGVAARRKAEEMITGGRVLVNGKVANVLGTKVDPAHDRVTVDGEAVVALDHFYVLLNKPKACITSVTDDRGRPTVMDYLPNVPIPVKPVGRLDFYTEGVLLLTNDGELAARLLAPASHVPKTYHVKVHGHVGPDQIKLLRDGIQLDDGSVTMPAEVEPLPAESKHTWLAITIHEGKHRQIHRMIEALGFAVDKLQRVAFANLTFHGLRIGDARELTQLELNALRDLVGLDHSAVARGKWRAEREDTDIPRRARAKVLAEAELEAAGAPEREPSETSEEGARRGGQGRTFGKNADRGPDSAVSRGPRGSTFGRRGSAASDRGSRSGPARGAGSDRGSRSGPGRSGGFGGDRTAGREPRGGDFGARSDRAPRGATAASRGPRREGASSDRGPRGASSSERGGFGGRGERGPARESRGGFGGSGERGPARGSRGSFGGRGERGPARESRESFSGGGELGPARESRGSFSGAGERGPARESRGSFSGSGERGPARESR